MTPRVAPTEWRISTLEDVAEVSFGTRVTKKVDSGSTYPVYGGGGATFYMDEFNRESCVVISRFGMSERCVRRVEGKFFLNDSGLTVESKDCGLLWQPFLDLQMFELETEIYELGRGTAQKNLNVQEFRCLPVFVPPLDEQKRIVAALDQASAALDRARAKAEESLSDARLVFDAHLHELFSSGERKEWSAAVLGDLADFRNGINFTKASRGKEVRVLGVKDFQNRFHAPDTGLDRVIIDGDLDPIDCLQSGDIVFVRSNGNPELIGRSLVIEHMSERTTHSGFTIRARLRDSEIVPSFLGHFLKSSAVRRQMVDGGTGTNIKSLNQGTLSRILVPCPSRAEQMRIVEKLEAVRESTAHVESRYTEQLADMAALRQSLLQAAFSGQLS